MAKDTLYNYNFASPVSVSREEYEDVGSGENIVGDIMRAIKGSTDFEIWDAPTGGSQLTEGVDYQLVNEDVNLTAEAGYTVYTGYQILNATYYTGSIYITYKIVGSYTDADLMNTILSDITSLQASQMTAMAKLTAAAPNAFWGDVVYKDADEIIIKPRGADGLTPFIGKILNNGNFRYSTAEMTGKLDVPGSSGQILDGITARLASQHYNLWFYENAAGDLLLGFTWRPKTTFSNANPTTTLTLNQVNGQDIGLLFPADCHLTIFQDVDEWESMYGYQDGGAITGDTTRDAPKISSRTSTVITLGAALSNATFNASSEVVQVDNFKPLAVDDGLIVDTIGSYGYADSGIIIVTDASGNIEPFSVQWIGSQRVFMYADGSGAADYSFNQGKDSTTINSGAWGCYRFDHCPVDKVPIYMTSAGTSEELGAKPYWYTYGQSFNRVTNYSYTNYEHFHGLNCLYDILGAIDLAIRGYVI